MFQTRIPDPTHIYDSLVTFLCALKLLKFVVNWLLYRTCSKNLKLNFVKCKATFWLDLLTYALLKEIKRLLTCSGSFELRSRIMVQIVCFPSSSSSSFFLATFLCVRMCRFRFPLSEKVFAQTEQLCCGGAGVPWTQRKYNSEKTIKKAKRLSRYQEICGVVRPFEPPSQIFSLWDGPALV